MALLLLKRKWQEWWKGWAVERSGNENWNRESEGNRRRMPMEPSLKPWICFPATGEAGDFATELSLPIANDLQRPRVIHGAVLLQTIISKLAIETRFNGVLHRFSRLVKVQHDALVLRNQKTGTCSWVPSLSPLVSLGPRANCSRH
jgi:hypothetical protein